ncbi:unnamed protein product [Phytophthora fragariaefolia]|uniref:Unnamed protein product n=1 Tax=Phytophthora fragariaefolia TaxID=1490495 RepID=A0A9W7CP11_9STRA|nr:unnamed protein product [Phytophthora fragariaefolia]
MFVHLAAKESSELEDVNTLRRIGVARKKILKYIWDKTDSEPCMVDVHNLLAKLKREEEAGTTVSERLSETFHQFCENEKYGVAHVDIERVNNETVLVDATHGTNEERYRLFSFTVHDSFDHGQYVQVGPTSLGSDDILDTFCLQLKEQFRLCRIHALLTDEKTETFLHAIRQFKRCNPRWTEIQCVVGDKDFTEIGVFKAELPHASVLLCQFHAVEYIQERISKAEYGLSVIQGNRLKPVVSLIVKAKTEAKYDECFRFMRQELGVPDTEGDGKGTSEDTTAPLFWSYFIENWHKCREMWCSYLRDNVVHLGNNTNNRLESSWQKIKTIVDQNVDIDESVTSLIWWAKVKQKSFTTELARVGQVFDSVHHTNVELTRLAQMVSRYAFDIVKEQFDIASNPDTYYKVRDEGNELYIVASVTTTCKSYVCSCIQYANLQDEEGLSLLLFAVKRELEDVCVSAAIDVIRCEADARPDSIPTCTVTPQLLAMDLDEERIAWLENNRTVEDAKNNIVGAVLFDGNHWCALCISLER